MTDIPTPEAYSQADISNDYREYTVDEVMNNAESSHENQVQEEWVPSLTVKQEIAAAKTSAIRVHDQLAELLRQALVRKEEAQNDINNLREAMIVWEPIHSRLMNGPIRRNRDNAQAE
jgi:5'-deoxynucleotidase YfbR-like HD superfamily hydrolase